MDEVPEVQPPNDSSQNITLQARQLAVLEQDRLNRIAMEDYILFDRVRVAFTIASEREVEVLRNEDLNVFSNGENMMTDMAVKVVLW